MTWIKKIDPFLADHIRKERIFLFDELESTNKTAKEMAGNPDIGDFAVVIAGKQTDGRGCGNRTFISPEGGIYASFIFKPLSFSVAEVNLYTFGAATAAREAIEEVTGKAPKIKWVNDLLLDDLKICGILTESRSTGSELAWVVVGVGINYYTDLKYLPEDLREKAGAIFTPEEEKPPIEKLTAELINKMFLLSGELNKDEIIRRYNEHLMR